MTRLNRRDWLRVFGAGWLAAKLARPAGAQAAQENAKEPQQNNATHAEATPAPMLTANKTVVLSASLDETYFWRDDQTVLFLRRTPGKTVFRAVFVDSGTGEKTLPQEFNARNSRLMESGRMIVSMEGSPKREMHYLPPRSTLSPDRKWLLWSYMDFPRSQWVAATFDGQQQRWAQGSDPVSTEANLPNHALWMPDSTRWVELVSRYDQDDYSIHIAHVYSMSGSAPVSTVQISGLQDGLPVGIRQDETVVMNISRRRTDGPVRQIDLSLVSLEAAKATAQKLSVPIPVSAAVWDVTLSPQGDRLAWILEHEHSKTRLYTLYTADADGAHARPIDSAEGVQVGKEYSWPRVLRWLPDGKQVSFVYKSTLYTLPAS